MDFLKALMGLWWFLTKKSFPLVLICVLSIALYFLARPLYVEIHDRHAIAPKDGEWIQTEYGELFIQRTPAIGTQKGTIIFLHGMAAWSATWKPTMGAIAHMGFASLAVDMPPFGFSERPNNQAFWRTHNAKRIESITSIISGKRYIVAHSYGSRAALEYVLAHQEMVDGLVLVNPALDGIYDNDSQRQTNLNILRYPSVFYSVSALTMTNPFLSRTLLQKFMHRKEAATDDTVSLYTYPSTLKRSTYDMGSWIAGFLAGDDVGLSSRRDAYAGITVPIVLIWGEEDTTTPLKEGQQLAEILGGAPLMVLPGVGHMPHIESPIVFYDYLDKAMTLLETMHVTKGVNDTPSN